MTGPTPEHLAEYDVGRITAPPAWTELFEALTIMSKGYTSSNPFQCSDDLLCVCVNPGVFTADEIARLGQLGFFPERHGDGFFSYKYGNA